MKKEKVKGKKGCWWRGLMAILLLLLGAGVALLVTYINQKNSVDEQFQKLVNQEFDSTAFSDTVSTYRVNFATKLRSATGNNDVCSDNGTINFDVLTGGSLALTSDWMLSKYDLAIYCSQRNEHIVLSDDNLELILKISTISRITWTISAPTGIEYTIIYQIPGSSLKSRVALNNAPEYVYLTAQVILDLSLAEPVKMYKYTINSLNDEDSNYCLKHIFGESNYTEKLQKQLAYTPISYLNELNKQWGSSIVLASDTIKITK